MALQTKKKSARSAPRKRRLADMTTNELRAMIERMIERKLADSSVLRRSKRAATAQMKRQALSAAGRFHSGQSDISKRHDDYLMSSYRE